METDQVKQHSEGQKEVTREGGLGDSGFSSTPGTQSQPQPTLNLTAEPLQLMRSQDEPENQAQMASSESSSGSSEKESTRGEGTRNNGGTLQLQDSDDESGAPAPARRGRLRSGPTYTPNGTIAARASGGMKTATFRMAAEFDHDPASGIYASCCEVRQYIKWSAGETSPNHAGFRPASGFSPDTWYEDRDGSDKRYGHRSGAQSDPQSFDQYLDSSGTRDQANGTRYVGSDSPRGNNSRTGLWYFRMDVIDVCNGNRVLGSDHVTVDW